MKKKKKFVADFETINDINDCRVWCWSISEIGNTENTQIGKTIEEFFAHLETIPNSDVYFHNLAFDGQFILSYLLNNTYVHTEDKKLQPKQFSTLITDDGAFYIIKVCLKRYCNITFYDSLKKLPFKVKVIAKAFGLQESKGEIDYNKYRPVGYELDENEKEYVKNDTIIVAKALEHQFNENLTKMTIASDALSSFKSLIEFEKFFPSLDDNIDQFCRKAYRGGWVYVNPRYQNKDCYNIEVYDVNSLYPSQMYDQPLPYGDPVYFKGEYQYDPNYPLYIIHILVRFKLKENALPMIQIKNNYLYNGREYLDHVDTLVDLTLTNVDFELFKDMYDILDIEYLEGFKFASISGLFKPYIDKWNKVKMDNTGEGGVPALRTIAKLMLNSLYGKFATRTHTKKKIPYLKENGVVGYMLTDEEIKESIYTPVACFITAWARNKTIRSAYNLMQGKHKINGKTINNDKDYFIYADTDSIHTFVNDNIEYLLDIDSKELGKWKHESSPDKARFLRAKTYIECMGEDIDVKCAGMSDEVKKYVTFDNFHYGFIDTEHKLGRKTTKGGVVLQPTPFEIKEIVPKCDKILKNTCKSVI